MSSGTGLDAFEKEFPERFFDVGIAEEHAATFSAGLCASGKKPVFAVYSTFLQRCYDNIVHDIALQNLPVIFALDRAGLAEADGPTHHGIFDVSMIMSIPDTILYAPLDFKGLERCFDAALENKHPTFIRYKSGGETVLPIKLYNVEYKGEAKQFVFSSSKTPCKNLIITYGKLSGEVAKAVLKLNEIGEETSMLVLEQLKGDLDITSCIASLIKEGDGTVVFAEEGIENGGAASCYMPKLAKMKGFEGKKFKTLAIKDFAISEKGKAIFETCGISSEDIIKSVLNN